MPHSYKADLVGLFGTPVAENPTCIMQEAAFAAAGLNWRYLTIEVQPDALADAVRGARAMGMRGLNLTIPHKVAVMPLLDQISRDADIIGAVNTVRREGDTFIGENTDGKGFLRGLRETARIDPGGKRVLLLGAGGAARAIAVELALAGAAEVIVCNRGTDRGESMVWDLTRRTGAKARFEPWRSTLRVDPSIDILVQATSIGLFPDVTAMPDLSLNDARPDLLVCDVIPNPPQTPLLRAATDRGMKTLDGLTMLVGQGLIGFNMWTGHDADESVMKAALSQAFAPPKPPSSKVPSPESEAVQPPYRIPDNDPTSD